MPVGEEPLGVEPNQRAFSHNYDISYPHFMFQSITASKKESGSVPD